LTAFERSSLGTLTKLGGGGQGDVYHAPKARINFAASVAFKEYKPAWRRSVDFGALEAMATFLGGRSFDEGSEIVARVAWPTKVVTDAGAPVGFLMPEVADEFRISVRLPSGKQDRPLAGLQLLLNSDDFLHRRGIAITERDRYLLLAEIAESLALLHRYDIAVGDLSPKNVLFSLTPSSRCFFVDADAMRMAGRSALPQAETPDWEISTVSSEELATAATDRYKLGLLVLRLLAGDQSTRDPSALPGSVPSTVRGLIVGALVASSASRPAAADWLAPLRAAASGAKTTVTAQSPVASTRPQAVLPVVAPAPARPAATRAAYVASGSANRGGLPWTRLAVLGLVAVVVAAVVVNMSRSSSSYTYQYPQAAAPITASDQQGTTGMNSMPGSYTLAVRAAWSSTVLSPSTISCSSQTEVTRTIKLPSSLKGADQITDTLDGNHRFTHSISDMFAQQPDGSWLFVSVLGADTMCIGQGVTLSMGPHTWGIIDASGNVLAEVSWTLQP
jgi:hypothetical protein